MSDCAHHQTKPGEIIPLRWGSARSEVCLLCGSFRQLTHFDQPRGPWQPKSEYAAAIAPSEDE